MKKILTVAATISLAVAGFTSITSPQTASAVSPTSNLYGLNVANQSAGSGANSFVELFGKTYFVASTLSKATAIWSVDGDITKAPEFIFDPFTDSTSGRIQGMWGHDKYLFFWISNTKQYGQPIPWVINVETKVAKQVLSAEGENILPTQGAFAETNGTIYGWAQRGYGQQTVIVKFNPADMTVSVVTETPYAVRESGNGESFLSGNAWTYAPTVLASGNFLYVLTSPSNYNRDDSKIFRYDLVGETWSDFLDYNGTVFEYVRTAGPVTYNGERGIILSKATSISTQPWWQNISNFESYFIKPNGTFLRLGSWVSAGREGAPFNLNGELYMSENYGNQIYKIDATTGERTNALTAMFPGITTTPYLRAVKEVDDKLVFSMKVDNQSQEIGFLLYSWDGINPATRFTDVNPPVGQQDYDASHSNSNSGGNYEIGAMGNYTIKVLHRDSTIGAEPYYIAQNGTVTLMKDMNRASDGSDPDSSCFISTTDGDWMTGNLPIQTGQGRGKDVIVSMKPEGKFLQYSVIDPGEINNPCGFTYIGEDVYFQGETPDNYDFAMYKMTPDGTITKLFEDQSVDEGSQAVSYGGNYYWLGEDHYDYNLWKYEPATNTVTQLTGNNGDEIRSDDTYEMSLIGSKLYLLARVDRDHVFEADLSQPTFALRNLTSSLTENNSQNWEAENLTNFNGKLLFSSSLENRDDPSVYQVDPDTGEVSVLFDVEANTQYEAYVDDIIVMGNKVFVMYEIDNNVQLRKWTSGDTAAQMPLPEDFELNCLAPIGGNLVVQDQDGDAFYYGNGLNLKRIDYDFSGNTGAFCGASFTEHGSYLQLPEYPYDGSGTGFGQEPGYIGPLTPIAVSRLGEPVNEGPSVPLSNDPPSETTPVAPGKPGTPVASSGPGVVSLSWTAPSTGGAIATYVVESTPEGADCEITGTTAECIGMDPGTQYSFKVIATNAGGITYSSASNTVTAQAGGGAPGEPGTPTVVGKDGGATITWTAPTTGGAVDSYVLQSSPAGATCVITGLTADCTGLNNNDVYTFSVIAVNDTDITFSKASSEVTIGDPATLQPSKPKVPILTPGKAKMTVTVIPPTSAGVATSYMVYLNGDTSRECEIIAPAVSCVFEGLDYTYQYNAYYSAINANGSSWSDYSQNVYPYGDVAPDQPIAPKLTSGPGSVTVKVAQPAYGGEVANYDVTLSPGGATCNIVAPATTCVISDLDPTIAYTAIVIANNEIGSSYPSESSNEVTPQTKTPGTPRNPTVVAGINKVTVKVTPPTTGGAPTSYLVTLSPGGKTCTVVAPATTCDVTELDPTVAYTASVVAINADGESAPSGSSAAVTPISSTPKTPGEPTLVAGPGKVTVTVTPASSGAPATSYLVTLSPGGKTCTVTVPAVTCEITGLDSTVAYEATVVAINADGQSAASESSEEVTPLIALPGTPAAPTVVIGNAKVTVTAAPALIGGPATTLTATATPGGASCVITLPATNCEITGLTNKTSYTFAVVATNSSGSSSSSAASDVAIPVDPNADVAPEEGDGGKAPKGIPSGGTSKFVATNDSTFQVAWDKKTGKLISRATGIYTGYIEAKITFVKAGKTYVCTAQFGVLKVMPQKTAAQKAAAMKMKTFTGKQFCIDKMKMDPKTLAPKGGMTTTNFKKIKATTKTAAEMTKEKAALAALKGFTGRVDIQVTRYRAWPTTMLNVGDHTGKGGKIPFLIRNTKVTLG